MDMTLSKRGDYVMRSAISLARAFERGEGRKIREVVEETEVPRTFASQILADLVRAGLALSKAGRDGGYRLSRSPGEISVLEVVEAAEGPLRAERCALGAGPCRWDEVCPLHETWTAATAALRELLAVTTLAEVAARDVAIEAGTYPVPPDAHRSRPQSVPVADVVQVEREARDATTGLVRLDGRLVELVAAAVRDVSAPSPAPGELRADGSLAAASVEPEEGISRFLLAWHAEQDGTSHRLEGELSVEPVDEDRCEVHLDGAWRQAGADPLSSGALERQARAVARSFLRGLARELEESPRPHRPPRLPAARRAAPGERPGRR